MTARRAPNSHKRSIPPRAALRSTAIIRNPVAWLPALRQLGNSVDLANAGQTNVFVEYNLHNLSDADFAYSGPAVIAVNTILQTLAPDFGLNPADPGYLLNFRNPVFSFPTGERLMIIYYEKGSDGVRSEVQKVRDAGTI
jgi:hypothetical protein